MSPIRARATGFAVATSLVLTLGGLAGPAIAADDPADAVEQLFDAVDQGRFEAIDALVCEAEREAVREMLEPTASMGIAADALAEALTFEFEDFDVEVTAEDADTATVVVSGTMSMDLGGADPEELARTLLIADMGEDISEEDIAWMMPLVEMAFSQSIPLDQELELVVEDGAWVVCGGLGTTVEEPDYGFEPSLSSEGLCGLVSPDELNALSELQYDSSNGFADFCNYSNSDFESFHSATVDIEFDTNAEYFAEAYGADQPLEVAGLAAWASESDEYGLELLTQAGDHLIIVTMSTPEDMPDGLDGLTQAMLVTELFLPLVDEAYDLLVGSTPVSTAESAPEVPLCGDISLDELNDLTGLGLDEQTSDGWTCQFVSVDGDPGFHFIVAALTEAELEAYAMWIGEYEEGTVAGLPALITEYQTIVQLPDGTRVMDITVSLDTGDEGLSVTAGEVAEILVERILPGISDA